MAMTLPVLFSASTKAVEKVLTEACTSGTLSVDERSSGGKKTVSVRAVDASLDESRLTTWCVDLYSKARASSELPVEVRVEGAGGAGRILNSDMEAVAKTASAKSGSATIAILAWPSAAGPEKSHVEVTSADPTQRALLTALLSSNRD